MLDIEIYGPQQMNILKNNGNLLFTLFKRKSVISKGYLLSNLGFANLFFIKFEKGVHLFLNCHNFCSEKFSLNL